MANLLRVIVIALAAVLLQAETVQYKQRCLQDLVSAIPAILKSQDPKTGRFGTGIWIVNDQNNMLPLAAAWSIKDPLNPYHHSPKILDAIMLAGDALIDDQDAIGKWVFRKKDGSTWGPIYMPWTYSRWIRAFQIVREEMPAARRARWEKALVLGFTGIAKEIKKDNIKNIPAHHAMALYIAGNVFNKPEWKRHAADYLHAVIAAQHSDGYWTENKGPVVQYGMVYADALGTYYAVSGDEAALPALRKTAVFHTYFTYPDGSGVETVDERNPYHAGVIFPNVGFTFTPEGLSYIARQLKLVPGKIAADAAASFLLWGREGEGAATDLTTADFDYRLPSGDAAIRRRGPWFLVLCAMSAPVPSPRWIQDRQNLVSIYHEKAGLVLGGGNTKLQPSWSNFTVGDISKFFHKAGDENPKFQPPAGVLHVPTSARLLGDGNFGLELEYDTHRGRITLQIKDATHVELKLAGDAAMTGHVTLLPHMKKPIACSGGEKATLSDEPFTCNSPAWVEHAAARLTLPPGSKVRWPLLPHDPYRKDGRATPEQGRIVIDSSVAPDAVFNLEIRN